MKVIEPGHIYELKWLDCKPQPPDAIWMKPGANLLVFVNREQTAHPGTQTQEVLRALIDRNRHCDNCLRWEGNDDIIYHLRMALVLHEARALIRKAEKGYYAPEDVETGKDGHFLIGGKDAVTSR